MSFRLQRFGFNLIKTTFNYIYTNNVTRHSFPLWCQHVWHYGKPFKSIPMFMVVYAALPKADRENNAFKIKKSLLEDADELFDSSKYVEVVELLNSWKDSEDVEVLWRLSRALYKQSRQEADSKKKQYLIKESFELIKSALALDDTHFAVHKWYSILLDSYAASNGMKARINELQNVKQHMIKAIELNPKDATTIYMLGQWCYGIADMAWYQRKIASTLFAAPPTSSYEEALTYFCKAEETDPNFYSLNLLMLGKTYWKLQKLDEARHYLSLASAYPAKTDEDVQTKKEAAELLKKISL